MMPEAESYKNQHQIFTLQNGKIIRHYIYKNQIFNEEFMYIHFWCRPITYKPKKYTQKKIYVIYADTVEELEEKITKKYILKKSRRSKVKYYLKSIWFNRKKITIKRILFNMKGMLNYKKENKI